MRRSYSTFIRRLVSPVFFSTAEDGSTQRGLAGVPNDRPMLLVGNHQTFALDLGLFVEQIVRERGFLPRGLAHPAIFSVRPSAHDVELVYVLWTTCSLMSNPQRKGAEGALTCHSPFLMRSDHCGSTSCNLLLPHSAIEHIYMLWW